MSGVRARAARRHWPNAFTWNNYKVIFTDGVKAIRDTLIIAGLAMPLGGLYGVLLGYLVTRNPFGLVMGGLGIITLTGIVVNNNIVLIETYDTLRHEGMNKLDAIIQTCRERARPVILTAATAILGVLPIAFGINLELMTHETTIGAPSTQWWISLSSAIVFGLAFSTVLTLIITPSALMVFTRENPQDSIINKVKGLFRRKPKAKAEPASDALPAE